MVIEKYLNRNQKIINLIDGLDLVKKSFIKKKLNQINLNLKNVTQDFSPQVAEVRKKAILEISIKNFQIFDILSTIKGLPEKFYSDEFVEKQKSA